MDLPTASACSCPSCVQAKLAGLGTPRAFASPAYVYAFVAMLKVLPVASASQAYSFPFEGTLKAVRRATAMAPPFAFRAYSSASAEAKAVVTRIVWPKAEQAGSSPACCPFDSGLRDSFVSLLYSY